MDNSAGWAFYQQQLAYIRAKDVDGLIDNHYDDDAVLISFDHIVKGRADLARYFRAYVDALGDLAVESTDKFTATDDSILFEATMRSNLGRARVYDAFVLRAGKISRHFSGVIETL